jgi:hypothetical protein
MKTGILLIFIFVSLTGVLIYRFEKPSKSKRKITGRGGDFEG